MRLNCQKEHFSLPDNHHYLNNAYLGPTLKTSREASHSMMNRLELPYQISGDDYFKPVTKLRQSFAQLIGCNDPDRIAVIPSASYGLSTVAKQIKPVSGSNIIIAGGQFPSNVYPWMRLCEDHNCELRTAEDPGLNKNRGANWNENILNQIDAKTALVAIAPLMWMDGTLFDLKAIRAKTSLYGAKLIIDGSQAIGALPFNVAELKPDALVTAGYKWLFGYYGMSLAYFGECFDDGIPIEENWIIRENSRDFKNLTNYTPNLQDKGLRYSSGQHSSFVHIAVLQQSIDQILKWGLPNIEEYCRNLFQPFENELQKHGYLESTEGRSAHLIGLHMPDSVDVLKLKSTLDESKVYTSVRGSVLRLSLNVYNEAKDLERLVECLTANKI